MQVCIMLDQPKLVSSDHGKLRSNKAPLKLSMNGQQTREGDKPLSVATATEWNFKWCLVAFGGKRANRADRDTV